MAQAAPDRRGRGTPVPQRGSRADHAVRVSRYEDAELRNGARAPRWSVPVVEPGRARQEPGFADAGNHALVRSRRRAPESRRLNNGGDQGSFRTTILDSRPVDGANDECLPTPPTTTMLRSDGWVT